MGSSRHENVNKLLKYYDECSKHMDGYKPMIKEFLKTLQSKYNSKMDLSIKIHHFYRVGSTYDNLAVHPQTDFDIGMVLSGPYNMDCFKVTKTEYPGVYTLKCVSGSHLFQNFLSYNNFFNVKKLKERVSDDLICVLKSMKNFNGYEICTKTSLSGIDVQLYKLGHDPLKLDIIPQMEGKVNHDLPDWNGEYLNSFIKDITERKRFCVFFTLTPPPPILCHQLSTLMVQAAFTVLESESARTVSTTVFDAVRISKGLLTCNKSLKRGGLRSFQITRVALKYLDEIDRKKDSWDGYKLLMNKFIEMLLSGGVDGYLIKDQQCLWRNEEQCEELGRNLRSIFQGINPQNVLEQLVTDRKFYNAARCG